MLTSKVKSEICSEIRTLSRKLMLSTQLSETCMEEGTTQKLLEFVRDLLQDEVELRDQNKINRLMKKAAFPCYKSFDNYEMDRITLPEDLSFSSITDCSFIDDKTNLVLYGPVGTGKSHMAVATGIIACQKGLRVRFFTVASLVRLLSQSAKNGNLEKLIQELQKIDLLILDEWGYVPVDREGARLLFQVISDSYERKSIIITTNLEFSRWGSVMVDEQMAAAMIDRLIHHGYLILFEGQSYRMEHALMRGEKTVAS